MPTRVHNRVGGEDGLLRKLGGAGRLVNAIDSYFNGSSGRDTASFLFFSGISSQAPDKEEGMVILQPFAVFLVTILPLPTPTTIQKRQLRSALHFKMQSRRPLCVVAAWMLL